MAKPRKFSPEFKAKIALAALRGEATTAELCRKHQLSDTLVARWMQQLLKQAHCIFSAATPDDVSLTTLLSQFQGLCCQIRIRSGSEFCTANSANPAFRL